MTGGQKIVIIAGPNGAGKTTFARQFLPAEADCPIFVNADLIAAALAPLSPETAAIRAGRLMLEEIDNHVRRAESFAFETTLSGLMYDRLISKWRQLGYRVKLIYLSLPNPEMAVARVAYRVAQGGHFIPEAVIRRRFDAGWNNFNSKYKLLVNAWSLYDNSQPHPVLIEEGVNDED
ncbi:MAG: AAA family ATPase [Acidobacteriota bacterium]